MKVPKETARLAAVVKQSGKPVPVTLWIDPRKDKAFRAAVDADRVMTIKQETVGSRKDFGIVGFHREKNVSYWMFPRSLAAFKGKRIVGIDYAVLPQPKTAPARRDNGRGDTHPKSKTVHEKAAAARLSKLARPEPPPRPKPQFRVTVRCVRFVEIAETVEARSKREAKAKALAALAERKVDFSTGTESRAAVRIESINKNAAAGLGAAVSRRQ